MNNHVDEKLCTPSLKIKQCNITYLLKFKKKLTKLLNGLVT